MACRPAQEARSNSRVNKSRQESKDA
ncbi:hypothetical protein EYZ11_012846 [Aspergillus tanneri]|uniref:Uncharacterized protein n=1 Tax=Aspergillus tanneri TaxID=1220188 RepID=A0A4S3IZ59_9EURO|nr:hypothetical protein EYZ11_012846 [Aspergillus tanneri]